MACRFYRMFLYLPYELHFTWWFCHLPDNYSARSFPSTRQNAGPHTCRDPFSHFLLEESPGNSHFFTLWRNNFFSRGLTRKQSKCVSRKQAPGIGRCTIYWPRGSFCMLVLPLFFCLKKRVRAGTNRPPKQARSRNRPPVFTFLKSFHIRLIGSKVLPAQPRGTPTGLYTSPGSCIG
jgi:hypothetical protein